jgi:iron complex transport system permease protein
MSTRAIGFAILLAIAAILLTPWIGPEPLNLGALWAGDATERRIFFGLRVSRTLIAFLAGGSLAIAGAILQALLRNSLATPYTLGVSSGAALGAVLAISYSIPAVPLAALAGGLGVLMLVLRLAVRGRPFSSHALILAGVSVTSVCSALITILHSYAGFSKSFTITSWLIGGVEPAGFDSVMMLAAAVVPVWAVLIYWAPAWNLLAFGETWAEARGLRVRRMLATGYFASSWLAAITVSYTGPIGFVGLLAPHVVRETAGADYRTLVPASALFGAAFLTACDALGRSLFSPAEVPAGVITAMVGGPGLVWILYKEHGSGGGF